MADAPRSADHGEAPWVAPVAARSRGGNAPARARAVVATERRPDLIGVRHRGGRAVEGPDVAILTEGITDTLAALLAFPGCVVLGANGASRMEDVAAAIAPRLVAARGWLLVVPDVDGGTGEDNAAEAVVAAERAGLKLDASILLVDVRPHKDLADAVQAGWRWRWPS